MSFKKKYIVFGLIFIFGSGLAVGFYLGLSDKIADKLLSKANASIDIKKEDTNVKELAQIKNVLEDLKTSSKNSDIDFELYKDVWDSVKKYHIKKDTITDNELFYGSLQGIISAVNDPYSSFFSPEKAKQFTEEISGKFEGIGIHIGVRDDSLTVISPIKGSPADKAGILAGDKILFIDDVDTSTISIDEAVLKIRGQKGTSVKLTVFRDDGKGSKEIQVVRDTITIKTVEWEKIERPDKNSGNYFYLKLSAFNETSFDELDLAVKEILKQKPNGIIFDLRNNPGGLLDLAIQTASLWVNEGVIVTEKFSDGKINKNWSTGYTKFKDIQTIVLINQGSASASEIVAGALQDHNKAVLVGEQSFGKGSVQSLFEFNNNSAAKITIAEWLTPKDRQIEKKGITPDIIVEYNFEDYKANKDPQLDYAKSLLGLSKELITVEIENNKKNKKI